VLRRPVSQEIVVQYEESHSLFPAWLNVLQPTERVSFAKEHPIRRQGHHQGRARFGRTEEAWVYTTPALVIGTSVIVGFDPAKIDLALRSLLS
jgi:hypothetical protein